MYVMYKHLFCGNNNIKEEEQRYTGADFVSY